MKNITTPVLALCALFVSSVACAQTMNFGSEAYATVEVSTQPIGELVASLGVECNLKFTENHSLPSGTKISVHIFRLTLFNGGSISDAEMKNHIKGCQGYRPASLREALSLAVHWKKTGYSRFNKTSFIVFEDLRKYTDTEVGELRFALNVDRNGLLPTGLVGHYYDAHYFFMVEKKDAM